MSTYSKIIYHIVFSTKNRERTLDAENRKALYQFIWGVLKNKKCHLYRIGGIDDHVHILTSLHPTLSLSALVKDIKLSASKMVKEQNLFPHFAGWQNGYGAFTHSQNDIPNLVAYIQNQETHHREITFIDEYKILLDEAEIPFKADYLLE